jgi:hypothetical protein
MRSHGVPKFPDPTNDGGTIRIGPVDGLDPGAPRYQGAEAACGSLLPGGGGPLGAAITPADELDYLKAAACMRDHGIPDFPDPTIVGGHVKFSPPPSMNRSSPQVEAALTTCRKLIPAGLPYSN